MDSGDNPGGGYYDVDETGEDIYLPELFAPGDFTAPTAAMIKQTIASVSILRPPLSLIKKGH